MFVGTAFVALVAAQASSGVQWAPLQQQQQAPAQQAQPVVSQTPAATRFLPAATIINVTALQELSSKHIRQGERYKFAVVNDVAENGVVVIPRGSIAIGVVTMKTGRAVGGKSGKFDVTFESVTANGVRFPLSGVHHQEGKGNTVGAVFGSLIISGHSAVLQPGQILTAFTADRTAY